MMKKKADLKIEAFVCTPGLDAGGYGKMGREMMLSLYDLGVKVQFKPFRVPDLRSTVEKTDKIIEMINNRVDFNAPSIWAVMPQKLYPRNGYKILYTMIETEKIHKSFATKLNYVNEVWVPSKFCEKAFLEANIVPTIKYMPLGVNTELYKPMKVSQEQKNRLGIKTKKFVFLSLFGWSLRKGYDILLRAYLKAFTSDDDVTLLIASRKNGNPSESKGIPREILKYVKNYCKNINKAPNIIHIGNSMPENDLPKLYNLCDAFVLPSRGEGFCTFPDAKIRTPYGTKEICNVKKGSLVLNHRGQLDKVIEVFKRKYNGSIISFITNVGKLSLTPNHPVRALIVDGFSKKEISKILKKVSWDFEKDILQFRNYKILQNKELKLRWVESKDIKKGDFLFYPNNYYKNESDINDFKLIEVLEILKKNYIGFVYNIGVKNDNSYICEGFAVHNCLPMCEAGACEKPVISTRCCGMLDFLNDNNSFLIDTDGYGKNLNMRELSSYYHDMPFAILGNRQVDLLSETMRDVFLNIEESKKKGKILRKDLVDNFTWNILGLKIKKRLGEIYGKIYNKK